MSGPCVGVLGHWATRGSATALLCPQGAMTPWLQGTSRDLSQQRPELTIFLSRDRRDTESKQDTLPRWL